MEELKKKVSQAIKQPLVGETIFSEEESTSLYSYVGGILREYIYGASTRISSLNDEIIFVAMVNAVKEWASDESTFWSRITKILIGTTDCPQKLYKALTEIIDRLGSSGRILYLQGKRFYATLLAHAFSPLISTESFFELCWQIYCEDMSQYYSKNDTVFESAARELSRRFGTTDNDEDFQLGSKAYSLRAGIKRLAIDQPEIMATLIRDTIETIHMLFNSEPIEESTYRNSLIHKWWNRKEASFGIQKEKHINREERAVSDYSAIKLKYANDNGNLSIVVPAFRLLDNYDTCPWVEAYYDNSIVYSAELLTKGSGLLMTTKTHHILLDQFSVEEALQLRIVITHCGSEIYDSKNSLYRTFILFNGEREIFSQECLPGNYQLYTPDAEALLQSPNNIRKVKASYYVFNAVEGEMLQSTKRTVLFASEKQHRDIWIQADKKKNLIFRKDENEYSVVDGELKIAALATANLSDYGVRYEECSWKLQDFSSAQDGDIILYNISELLSVGEPQTIVIFKYSNDKIVCRADIVKFNNVEIIFDREYYYDKDRTGTVRFLTQKFDVTTSFDIDQPEVSLSVADGEVVLQIPTIRWRIDDRAWNNGFQEKGIWYKDFTNSSLLEFDIPSSIPYNVMITPNSVFLEKPQNGADTYKMGQQIYSQIDKYDEAMVLIVFEDKTFLPILRIHTKSKFIEDPILQYDHHHLIWDPRNVYIGDKNDSFEFSLLDKSGAVVKTINLEQNALELDLSQIIDGYYSFNIDLKQKSLFKNIRTTLLSRKIIIGDENQLRFRNKTIVINQVMLGDAASPTYIKTIYIENLRFIGKIDDSPYYSGSMYFIHNSGNMIYLDKMKNDAGDFDKTNPVRIELRSDNSCWMVAGLEIDDINDFLGELFLDQYHKISNFTKRTQAIDYYIFSTKETKHV